MNTIHRLHRIPTATLRALRRHKLLAGIAVTLLVAGITVVTTHDADRTKDTTTTTFGPAYSDERREPQPIPPQEIWAKRVRDLLGRYDDLSAQIVASRDTANDPNHPLRRLFNALVTPTSQLRPRIIGFRSSYTRDYTQRTFRSCVSPESCQCRTDAEVPVERRLAGTPTRVSSTEISFPVEFHFNYLVYHGNQARELYCEHSAQTPGTPGTGTIRRIGDTWRLHSVDIHYRPHGETCRDLADCPELSRNLQDDNRTTS